MRKSLHLLVFVLALVGLTSCLPPPPTGQGEAGTPKPVSAFEFIFYTSFYIVCGAFIYYFLVTKPKVDQEEQQKRTLAGLKPNEEVVTSSGIFGRIISVKSDAVTLEVAANVRIRVKPEHIVRLTRDEPKESTEGKKAKEGK